MGMTLEVPPVLAAELDAIASREGTTVEQHAVELLRLAHAIFDVPGLSREFRSLNEGFDGPWPGFGQALDAIRESVKKVASSEASPRNATRSPRMTEPELPQARPYPRPSALGKYAHLPGGSEAFAREKQEEIAREDAKFR